VQKISPFLWFDGQAEEAMDFYVSVFPNSRILEVSRYGDAGPGPKGTVMVAVAELDGQRFHALNGGPQFKFTPAISFYVDCTTQQEVDALWHKLLAGGGKPNRCGWLTDRYGVSWQVVPSRLRELIRDPAVMKAMLNMQKLDIAALERAAT
jgi:predicted 3-demethylubiquinone-9 3-methyltransferase (glyoxalase superfamily)